MAMALTEDYGSHLDPGAQQYLERIVSASNRMDRLVQDLLEYARISRTQFELTAVDLRSVLEQVQSATNAEAEAARAKIEVQGAMPRVFANPTLLTQVLTNLISNAIKFVRTGTEPVIQIEAKQLDDKVRVCVTDNGIGIAPEYHAKIFRMFERLHSINEYPGTGIGLTIVQKAMSQMRGKVGLESSPGAGSMFWIELTKAAP
jgi:signal transduction histidine kinase